MALNHRYFPGVPACVFSPVRTFDTGDWCGIIIRQKLLIVEVVKLPGFGKGW